MRQMPIGAIKMIGQIGAALATFFPARTEHKVIDDQLAASLEQIAQRFFSLWSLKRVPFLDFHHRELAPRCTECVALACELLFPGQQIPSSNQPLSFRYDFRLFVCYFHFCFSLDYCVCLFRKKISKRTQ